MPAYWISKASSAERLPLNLTPAFSWWARLRGLLGAKPLAANQALWIRPCNSVHSCFMGFAIDVLYLNREQQIIAIRQQFKPWRFSFCARAHSVLELAAGEAARLDVGLGDTLSCDI